MPNDAQSLNQLKKKTKELVSKKIVEFLYERIPYNEIKDLAVFVNESLEKINTFEEFLNFLNELKEFYPSLENEVIILKNKLNENREKQLIERLQKYVSSF